MSTQRVVIVGGGFAGLSAAYTLKKRGITSVVLEALDRAGGRGKGEVVDRFSLDMGAFVFTSTYDTAFALCEELGLPLVRSQMKFGHFRNGRWVTTTPEQSLWNFVRHLRTAITMGFGSPAGMRSGSKVIRQRPHAVTPRLRCYSRIAAFQSMLYYFVHDDCRRDSNHGDLGCVRPGGRGPPGEGALCRTARRVVSRSRGSTVGQEGDA